MEKQTLILNDHMWEATYMPRRYGNFMRIEAFWYLEESHNWGSGFQKTSGGPMQGVTTEKEAMAKLLEGAMLKHSRM